MQLLQGYKAARMPDCYPCRETLVFRYLMQIEAYFKWRRVTRLLGLGQLAQEMERQGISKADLAVRMHTSRTQLDRILKAETNVTLETLQRAAALVGRELRVELQ